MSQIKELLAAKNISLTKLADWIGETFNAVNLYAADKVQTPISLL